MSEAKPIDRDQVEVIISLLRELVAWTKLANRPQLAERFMEILDSDQKKVVYEYSDGKRGVRDLSRLARVSKAVVSAWWRDWDELGIMELSPRVPGRRQRIVSLEALGIEVPKLPKERK